MDPKNYLQQPYARIVIPVEPNGFHAEILEFPGCFAQGNTLQKAYANLEIAAESWIAACLAEGQDIPEPSANVDFSGRIVLRLSKSTHKYAATLAERDGTSLNTYLLSAVEAKVGVQRFYDSLAQRLERRLMNAAGAAFHAWIEYQSAQTTPRFEIGQSANQLQDSADTSASLVTAGGR